MANTKDTPDAKPRMKQDPVPKYMAVMDRLMGDLNDKQLKFVFSYLGTKDEYTTRLKGILDSTLL